MTQRSNRDKTEIRILILRALRESPTLTTNKIALTVWESNGGKNTKKLLFALARCGAVKGARQKLSGENCFIDYWSITDKGRLLLSKYEGLLEFIPAEFKGSLIRKKYGVIEILA